MPLQLLDLRLEVIFQLVLLRSIGGAAKFLKGGLECLYTERDGLYRLVDIGCSLLAFFSYR
jgi:hypothetical protein